MPLPDDAYDDEDKDEMSLELDHSTAPPAAKRAREESSVPDQEHPLDSQQKAAILKQEVAHLKEQLEQKELELAQLLSQLPTNTANQPVDAPAVESPEEDEQEEEVVDLPPDEDPDDDEAADGVQSDINRKPGKKWTNQSYFLLKNPVFKITDNMIEADLKRLKEIDFTPEGEFLKDHWEALLEITQKGLMMLKGQHHEDRSKFLVWFEGKCQRHDGGTYYEGKGGAFRKMVDFVMSKILQKHTNAIHIVHDTQQHCSKDRNPFQEKSKCCVTYRKSQLGELIPLYEMIFQAVQHVPIFLISIGGMLSNDMIKRVHLKSCIKSVFVHSFHPRMAFCGLQGYGSPKYQAYATTVRYECMQEFLEVCSLIDENALLNEETQCSNFRYLASSSKGFKIEDEDIPVYKREGVIVEGVIVRQFSNVVSQVQTDDTYLPYSTEAIDAIPRKKIVGKVTGSVYNARWLKNFEDLKKFKNKTGNFFVPENYPANPSLGKWVTAQRKAHNQRKYGNQSGGMTDERIELLKSIGFITDQGHLAVLPCINHGRRCAMMHDAQK